MVVRCIKTSIPGASPSIINSNLQEYLEAGADYIVYGIRISEDTNYYMIFDDGHLVEVPSQLFEIIDDKVSPLWIIRCEETNGMTFWPELFHSDDFFENFSEWEEAERKAFDKLKRSFEEY